jgi:biopolymer transport protein ExbD
VNIRNPLDDADFFPELTPLIDVMFLLLVFFMLTTTFETDRTTRSIAVELPESSRSRPMTRENAAVITVREDGEYFLDRQPCDIESLHEVLALRMNMSGDSLVVIAAHRNAPYGRVVHIYDVLQALGVRHFSHEVR